MAPILKRYFEKKEEKEEKVSCSSLFKELNFQFSSIFFNFSKSL